MTATVVLDIIHHHRGRQEFAFVSSFLTQRRIASHRIARSRRCVVFVVVDGGERKEERERVTADSPSEEATNQNGKRLLKEKNDCCEDEAEEGRKTNGKGEEKESVLITIINSVNSREEDEDD